MLPRGTRVIEFDGLRGFLALWVFAYHAGTISGDWNSLPQSFRSIAGGSHAVDVFMILSGFAIATLVRDRPEPYGLFIARRFLRLFPVFFICLLAALLAQGLGL